MVHADFSKDYFFLRIGFVFGGLHCSPNATIRRNPKAFRFGVVRHPYDKFRSARRQWCGNLPDSEIGEITEELIHQMPCDEDFLSLIPIENVIRFEAIADEFERIATQINVPKTLPHARTPSGEVPFDPKRILPELTEEHKSSIYQTHRWTFEQFGYTP